ncbi:hypothetical protein AWZ74_22865 [Shigella sonnei]|nr:hypothetical protein AWZ74_22865 [Shigella sonnei]
MRAKSAQSHKNEAANGGENQHKTAGHGRTLRKLLFITKAEFFLFARLMMFWSVKTLFIWFVMTARQNWVK